MFKTLPSRKTEILSFVFNSIGIIWQWTDSPAQLKAAARKGMPRECAASLQPDTTSTKHAATAPYGSGIESKFIKLTIAEKKIIQAQKENMDEDASATDNTYESNRLVLPKRLLV